MIILSDPKDIVLQRVRLPCPTCDQKAEIYCNEYLLMVFNCQKECVLLVSHAIPAKHFFDNLELCFADIPEDR